MDMVIGRKPGINLPAGIAAQGRLARPGRTARLALIRNVFVAGKINPDMRGSGACRLQSDARESIARACSEGSAE